MLLLSIKPQKDSPIELNKGYSILAAISMVCYVTGLFALHWKKPKCQGAFLLLLVAIVIANIVLAIVFQREENIEYLAVSIFLIALNCILVFKAIKVYKKMKGKNIQSLAINK
jgi:membrane protein CcdC involved in cytochrome C biogenesis